MTEEKSRAHLTQAADGYADDVLSGKITACRWIIRACERWKHDLEHAAERGLYLDREAAGKAIAFIQRLRQYKGRDFIGKPMDLHPWQIFHFTNIFGWKWKDTDLRRFRHSFLCIARGNGKTQMAAGVGLKMTCSDGEGGSEVYSVANKIDQARISWAAACAMIDQDPILSNVLKYNLSTIHYRKTFSKFCPLSNESKTSDGFGPHCSIFDETHEMLTRQMIEVMETGQKKRTQPLLYEITTAGFDTSSVAHEDWEYGIEVLKGFDHPSGLKDDTYFPMIYTLDSDEEYKDEKCWIKANPMLDITVASKDLRTDLVKALRMPRKLRSMLVKNFNIWVNAAEVWLPMDKWPESGKMFTPASLYGRECFGALDLSSHKDLTTFTLMFPPLPGEDDWKYLHWVYTPEEGLDELERETKRPLRQWADQGWITVIPGARIDRAWIEKDILGIEKLRGLKKEKYNELFFNDKKFMESLTEEEKVGICNLYNIRAIGYDRWASDEITTNLEAADLLVVMIAQGPKTLNSPAKEFEARLSAGQISHMNNPVFYWCCGNAVIREDENKNICPSKKQSKNKIDLLMTSLFADAVTRADLPAPRKPSVYKTRGALIF